MYHTLPFLSTNINLVPTPSVSVFCLSELPPTIHLSSPTEIQGLRLCKGVAHELNPTPSLCSAFVLVDLIPANPLLVRVQFLCVGLASEPLPRPCLALELVRVGPDTTIQPTDVFTNVKFTVAEFAVKGIQEIDGNTFCQSKKCMGCIYETPILLPDQEREYRGKRDRSLRWTTMTSLSFDTKIKTRPMWRELVVNILKSRNGIA